MSDLHVSLISLHLLLIQNVIRMMSSRIWTIYAVLPFYLINSLSMVGMRSYLTTVVEKKELGRIFSLMSALDASLPVISSLVFAPLFRLTINSHPNLSFTPICVALTLGIIMVYIVSYQSKTTLANVERDRQALRGPINGGDGEVEKRAPDDFQTIA